MKTRCIGRLAVFCVQITVFFSLVADVINYRLSFEYHENSSQVYPVYLCLNVSVNVGLNVSDPIHLS